MQRKKIELTVFPLLVVKPPGSYTLLLQEQFYKNNEAQICPK